MSDRIKIEQKLANPRNPLLLKRLQASLRFGISFGTYMRNKKVNKTIII